MAISFNDAMATLRAMFNEMDDEVLKYVLESNNYHMENTIDTLLAMQTDAGVSGGLDTADNTGSMEYTVPAAAGYPSDLTSNTSGVAQSEYGLPDDFLSFGGLAGSDMTPSGAFYDDETRRQIEEDERLARMLQDQGFLNELMTNEDFTSMLDQGTVQAYAPQQQGFGNARHAQQHQQQQQQQQQGLGNIDDDDDGMSDFKRKLNNMSESAKKKFNELAAIFSSNNDNQAAGNRYATLPEEEESEDTEFIAFGGGQNVHNRRKQTRDSTSLLDNQDPSDSLFDDDDDEFVGGLADKRFEMVDMSNSRRRDEQGDSDDDDALDSTGPGSRWTGTNLGTGGESDFLTLGPTLSNTTTTTAGHKKDD